MGRKLRRMTVVLFVVVAALCGALALETTWTLSGVGHRLLEMGLVVVGFGLVYWCTQAEYLAALRAPRAAPPVVRAEPPLPAAALPPVPPLVARPPEAEPVSGWRYTPVVHKN